jgi:hypothetical protein
MLVDMSCVVRALTGVQLVNMVPNATQLLMSSVVLLVMPWANFENL